MSVRGGLEGQILEIVLYAIMLCCIMIGFNRGLLLGIFSVLQKILILAITLGAAPVIADALPESVTVAREGVGYAIALVAAVLIIHILSRLIKMVNDAPIIGFANRFGGLLLGAGTGFLIVWLLLGLLGAFQEYEICRALVSAARENHRIMWFQHLSPLPYILTTMNFPVL